MQANPLVAKAADVKKNSRQRAPCADGIRAIEKNSGNEARSIRIVGMFDVVEQPGFIKRFKEARGHLIYFLSAIVELSRCRIGFPNKPGVLVPHQGFRGFPPNSGLGETITPESFRRIYEGADHALRQIKDGVHRVRIIQVIRRNERSVGSARGLSIQELVNEVILVQKIAEHSPNSEILGADITGNVFPARLGHISGRIKRVKRRMTKRAAHSHPIRAYQIRIVEIAGIVVVTLRIPFCFRLLELRVRKQSQSYDAARLAVDFHRGRRRPRFINRWDIEPDSVFIRLGGLLHSRLVDKAGLLESIRPRPAIDQLEQIGKAIAVAGEPIPELFVAGAPNHPGISAQNFVFGMNDIAQRPWVRGLAGLEIHRVKKLIWFRQRGCDAIHAAKEIFFFRNRVTKILRGESGIFRFIVRNVIRYVRRPTTSIAEQEQSQRKQSSHEIARDEKSVIVGWGAAQSRAKSRDRRQSHWG